MSTAANTEQKSVTEAKSEMAFVDRFATALAKGETDQDRGREKAERRVAEAAESDDEKDDKKSTDSQKSDKSKSGKSAPGGTQDESDNETDDDEDDDESDDKVDDPDADDEDDETSDEDDDEEKGKDKGKSDDDADEVDEEDEAEKEASSALTKHGMKLSMNDVPEKYRPIVQQQLDNMMSSYSRAMAEARAYRKEEAQYRAERNFIEQNRAHAIVEMLEKGGEELEKQVNELLTSATGDEKGKKLFLIELKERRDKSIDSIQKEAADNETRLKRADEIETYLKTACKRLGLDMDIVAESAINRLLEKPADQRDMTNKELDAVIGKHLMAKKRLLGEQKQKQAKEAIRGRKRDRVVTSPAARGGSGSAATPAGSKPPQNDAEFAEHMASKLAGSRRARR